MRNQVEDLFHYLADRSHESQASYFERHDTGSDTLTEVDALLKFDGCVTDSLDRNIAEMAELTIQRWESQHSVCGPYKLREIIGRGGMGTVYLADRVDGEISHEVAVKLLRSGVEDPRARQRFLAERQILASLSHPNIAMLLDAGHREDGQPYLVMEHVEGRPIDLHTSEFAVRHIIRSFLKVCAAVAYLHRNLVVHRDLKPANILVTADGEPKLLDFGIAKILDAAGEFTQTSMRLLTPEYASPEQLTGEPITTASDIYSLGAVLYKLLRGSSPHQFETDSAAGIVSAVSRGRIKPPSSLLPALRSDLDSVLMKALRREPQERYATVEQFAEDLENFLQTRPVRARRGDACYRARKFVERHWALVMAVILPLAGLTGGALLGNHQRAIAQRSFGDVRWLCNKLFDIDVEVRKLAGNTSTRQLIVDISLDYVRRLSEEGDEDSDFALNLGTVYMDIARVQGVPIWQNLGQMDQAERSLRSAERLLEATLLRNPGNRTALLRSAQIAHDRMLLARRRGAGVDALAFARKCAARLNKFHAQSGDGRESSAILLTYLNVADQYMLAGEFDDALALYSRGSELAGTFNSPGYVSAFRLRALQLEPVPAIQGRRSDKPSRLYCRGAHQ